MTFDETFQEWDDTPVRCVECGALDSPQDYDHIYRADGPVCEFCADIDPLEAV